MEVCAAIKEESPAVLYRLSLSTAASAGAFLGPLPAQATMINSQTEFDVYCCQLGDDKDGDALMMTGGMIQVLGPVGSGSFVHRIDQAIFRTSPVGKKPR